MSGTSEKEVGTVAANKELSVGTVLVLCRSLPADAELVRVLEFFHYQVEVEPLGANALTKIAERRRTLSAVVLDRRGARNDDTTLLKRILVDPRGGDVPMLLLVARSDDKQLAAGLDAGIAYHLRAPFSAEVLAAAFKSMRRNRQKRMQERLRPTMERSLLPMAEGCKFKIRTPAEVEQLSPLLAAFFPDPRRAELGIRELLRNAVEHGNLEIGRQMKVELAKAGRLEKEIKTRLASDQYAKRLVEVVVMRKSDGVVITVRDDGKGFNWQDHIDVDPALANQEHGRGIARARHMAFDTLSYSKGGNQAVASMFLSASISW